MTQYQKSITGNELLIICYLGNLVLEKKFKQMKPNNIFF
jgi:hypothetical protein